MRFLTQNQSYFFHLITTWRPRHKGRVNQQPSDRNSFFFIALHGDQRQLKTSNPQIDFFSLISGHYMATTNGYESLWNS